MIRVFCICALAIMGLAACATTSGTDTDVAANEETTSQPTQDCQNAPRHTGTRMGSRC